MRGIAMAVLYFAFVIENKLAAREKPALFEPHKNKVIALEGLWLFGTFFVIMAGW